ncbi:hypothetical protein K2173_004287 [Erythroxylum novogranatense]|uniref:Prolamin-like domain-containing protein n=1 Tax=Erythroxylum novogranatense TaxID=1862640 RepID=A0AAV8U2F4_9ROSI|nr:hypothetical protein K2173_004287 [Erythroxylum novogranatense]
MAKLNSLTIFASIFIATVVIFIPPKIASALYFPHQGAPLPEPRPGYFKFLDSCIQGTNITCVKEIFETIFEDGTTSDDCCLALILIGKTCHDEFVKYIANGPSFKSRLSEYIAKSDQLYGRCAGIVDPTLAR